MFRFKGAGLSVDNDIEITGASDQMEIGAGFDPSSQSWSGSITGSGRLNVIGNAVLTGNNTYAGLTVVSIGSILVHGSHTGGGEWRVQGGSTALGGSGFIDSDVIFMSEAKFVFSLTDTLTVANGREVLFDPFFDVANGLVSFELAPVDWALVPAGASNTLHSCFPTGNYWSYSRRLPSRSSHKSKTSTAKTKTSATPTTCCCPG